MRFEDDGTVEVRHCWTEMGQGVHTVALQVAVEELGVDPDRDPGRSSTPPASSASARPPAAAGTLDGRGRGGRARADAAKAGGCQPGVDYEGEYRVDWTNSLAEGLEHPMIHSTFGYAAQLVVVDRETRSRRARSWPPTTSAGR